MYVYVPFVKRYAVKYPQIITNTVSWFGRRLVFLYIQRVGGIVIYLPHLLNKFPLSSFSFIIPSFSVLNFSTLCLIFFISIILVYLFFCVLEKSIIFLIISIVFTGSSP